MNKIYYQRATKRVLDQIATKESLKLKHSMDVVMLFMSDKLTYYRDTPLRSFALWLQQEIEANPMDGIDKPTFERFIDESLKTYRDSIIKSLELWANGESIEDPNLQEFWSWIDDTLRTKYNDQER